MNKKADVYAKHNMARISPKKVGVVLDMVRGEFLEDAKVILAFDPTKAARFVLKVLKSAESNAINNRNLLSKNLKLSDVYVNGARMFKWGHPGTKGRFNPMLKRNSHIVVGLSSIQADEKNVKKENLKIEKNTKVKEVKK